MRLVHPTAPVPGPSDTLFTGAIRHDQLWLWDSWTLREGDTLHLYCLALSRRGHDGAPILPPQRNDHGFHVRHFVSPDGGTHWRDLGSVLEPGRAGDGADARNVWSGSVTRLGDGLVAFGYTGLREAGAGRRFLQTICAGLGGDPDRMDRAPAAAISCPLRDYEMIRDAGYYLSPLNELGADGGEEGGPIMAWRDPFLLEDEGGVLHAFWSAKLAPTRPTIAHAILARRGDDIVLDRLLAPIALPDSEAFTQAEVPKIYLDRPSGQYLLLISGCDRMFEGQPDSDVSQQQRLYRADSLDGPWHGALDGESVLGGLNGLFGSSLIGHDLSAGRIEVLGPFTENAGLPLQLTFAPVRSVALTGMRFAARAG